MSNVVYLNRRSSNGRGFDSSFDFRFSRFSDNLFKFISDYSGESYPELVRDSSRLFFEYSRNPENAVREYVFNPSSFFTYFVNFPINDGANSEIRVYGDHLGDIIKTRDLYKRYSQYSPDIPDLYIQEVFDWGIFLYFDEFFKSLSSLDNTPPWSFKRPINVLNSSSTKEDYFDVKSIFSEREFWRRLKFGSNGPIFLK